ncbi:MAG: hypothetical protein KatS3mg114_1387 [Planctomycetaceae bacterium]|nr:MAG: hypothetical protein KatS3mg114_1387 [Planctomycetaceae bacterium]
MPGWFYEPCSRRDALWTLAGGIAGSCWSWRAAAGTASSSAWHLALLSDTHIPAQRDDSYRGFKPVENLQTIVPQVVASQASALLLSGDAARLDGQRGDYQVLRELLQPVAAVMPIIIGLGNHDDRDNFFHEFPAEARGGQAVKVSGRHVTLLEHPWLRIVMLDSLLYVNRVAGFLGKAQRTWLEQALPQLHDRPLVLFVHHTLGDGDGELLDAERLLAMVQPHPHVKAIFYGHSHRYEVLQRDGLQLVNLPASGYNFADDQPVGWVEAWFETTGVRLQLHAVGGARQHDGQVWSVRWLR